MMCCQLLGHFLNINFKKFCFDFVCVFVSSYFCLFLYFACVYVYVCIFCVCMYVFIGGAPSTGLPFV